MFGGNRTIARGQEAKLIVVKGSKQTKSICRGLPSNYTPTTINIHVIQVDHCNILHICRSLFVSVRLRQTKLALEPSTHHL